MLAAFANIVKSRRKKEIERLIAQSEKEKDTLALSKIVQDMGRKVIQWQVIRDLGDDYDQQLKNVFSAQQAVIRRNDDRQVLQNILSPQSNLFKDETVLRELEEKDYQQVLEGVLTTHEMIVSHAGDDSTLNWAAQQLSCLTYNRLVTRDDVHAFFPRIMAAQTEALCRSVEPFSFAMSMTRSLRDEKTVKDLGNDYAPWVNYTVTTLEQRRNHHDLSKQQKNLVNREIISLLDYKGYVPFADEKTLKKYGLLSVDDNGKKLARNLDVIEIFAGTRGQIVQAEYSSKVIEQLNLRNKKHSGLMHGLMILDTDNVEMKDVYENLEDIKNLKKTYNQLQLT